MGIMPSNLDKKCAFDCHNSPKTAVKGIGVKVFPLVGGSKGKVRLDNCGLGLLGYVVIDFSRSNRIV